MKINILKQSLLSFVQIMHVAAHVHVAYCSIKKNLKRKGKSQ